MAQDPLGAAAVPGQLRRPDVPGVSANVHRHDAVRAAHSHQGLRRGHPAAEHGRHLSPAQPQPRHLVSIPPDPDPYPDPYFTPSQVAIFCMLFLLSYYERLSAGALLCLDLVLLLLGLAAAVGASRRADQSSRAGGASSGCDASSGGSVSQSNDGGGAGQHGGGGGAGSPLGSARALRAATAQLLILVCWLLSSKWQVASSKWQVASSKRQAASSK